ncbi:MAG: carboxypeptidase-like regulatory domain-containing protein [Muribaculaceae bacterium]|nr:carboxypeptidase-like regulatory domain-containing protein [Muribaculaceae bacterium]
MQKVHFVCKCAVARLALVALMAFTSLAAMAQNKVSGTVTDETGEPLIGVTVLVKGTSNGIATDFNGPFALEVGG